MLTTYEAKLESISPYSQSRFHDSPKKEREIPRDYEERTWRERLHFDQEGIVFIPPMAFKNALLDCAKLISVPIPGKARQTYTKHFETGVQVFKPITLGIKKGDVIGEWLFLPSDGKRGGGKRVMKCYPNMPEWKGTLEIFIFDEIVTEKVLKEHLEKAGSLIGIGRFRPRNNGFYGRFAVKSMKAVG